MQTNLLQAQDNVIQGQGKRVFKHVADHQLEKRPASWRFSSCPESVKTLKEKCRVAYNNQREEGADARTQLEDSDADVGDDFDDMLSDE